MGKAPSVDDSNGAGVSDVTTGKTFWGLKSGEWGLNIGAGACSVNSAPVAKTGQTTSYHTHDDGNLKKGVSWPSTRFTDNGNGTVTDNLTGLIWLENANCAGVTVNWETAVDYCAALYDGCTTCFGTGGDCGLDDDSVAGEWRLPNVKELQSLIDFGRYYPALPSLHPFTGVQDYYYWSSSTTAGVTDDAWVVFLRSGYVVNDNKTYTDCVWPVRGGQ